MVRVKNPPPGGRATRRPGRLHQKLVRGGKFIVQKWPRKRGPIKSEAQKHTASQFALAQKAAAEAHPWFYIEAENMSTGTIWNRREILVKAAQGTLWEIRLADGSFYGNWFTLAREIQALLDTVTDVTGSILVRRAAGWQALTPGPAGYVMTSNGPDFSPNYQPAAAAPDVYGWSVSQPFGDFTGSDFTAGSFFTPAINCEVTHISFGLTLQVGATYQLCIAECASNALVQVIHQQYDVTTEVFAQGNRIVLPLNVPQLFERSKWYHVGLTKGHGGPSGSLLFKTSRGHAPPLPCDGECFISRKSGGPIVVGETLFRSGNTAHMQMRFREV